MPRKMTFTTEALIDQALHYFWEHGFYGSSMDKLVQATGVSRHGIYTQFGGKKPLFLACFDHYQDVVVTPAFQVVERPGADLESVAQYFEFQIARGESVGLPGPGCLVANSATEIASADADVMSKVEQHNLRLKKGFQAALQQHFSDSKKSAKHIKDRAELMVIFTNGLWSMSRVVNDASFLRQSVKTFLQLIAEPVE